MKKKIYPKKQAILINLLGLEQSELDEDVNKPLKCVRETKDKLRLRLKVRNKLLQRKLTLSVSVYQTTNAG